MTTGTTTASCCASTSPSATTHGRPKSKRTALRRSRSPTLAKTAKPAFPRAEAATSRWPSAVGGELQQGCGGVGEHVSGLRLIAELGHPLDGEGQEHLLLRTCQPQSRRPRRADPRD